ncbi:MAG: TAXI family TRAP transporter solute-binding subunit [Hyphomicrobiales bacterium]|uniref:TAXI family TRAP transporter solute-binding subunit n=1 Tax=Rhabdaerophilum calidifontis TaxID=2604328 RepID=UPI001238EB89|nr:TAXI family TRAP transporter solute-binding subunit [Rhabdaerophilum calidifontis]MCA1952331.1 TAXI family TRAP transporter solute-binding subunit [Hyphomicrobiales bacterium]MCA1998915.1 TAXI family TRAP transporter solute-binding subunit [Hyphomicrobiales bacterium]
MRHRLKVIALALVAVATLAALGYWLLAPRTLRIAVGPVGGADTRVVVAFLQALQRERAEIRLKLVLTEGAVASARAFAEGRADLAIVRSDAGLPPEGATVAIIRRDAVYLITRPGAEIARFSDLRGKTVGLIEGRPANDATFEKVLAHYGLAIDDADLLRGSAAELQQAAREGRLDAIFVVAPPADRVGRTFFQSFPPVEGQEPAIIAVTEADALVEDNPGLDTIEIVRGAFGGEPPRPAETLTTLAVSHRLIARRRLDDALIADLTRLLSQLRLAIVAEAPAANQIELPSTEDRAAKLPIHPGTIAYAEGETRTFFERYGDWFYLGVMGFSLVGSVVAAFWSRLTAARPPVNLRSDLSDFVRLIERVRAGPDAEDLAAIERESERLRADFATAMIANEPDADQIAAMRFLIDELEAALARRRAGLLRAG